MTGKVNLAIIYSHPSPHSLPLGESLLIAFQYTKTAGIYLAGSAD